MNFGINVHVTCTTDLSSVADQIQYFMVTVSPNGSGVYIKKFKGMIRTPNSPDFPLMVHLSICAYSKSKVKINVEVTFIVFLPINISTKGISTEIVLTLLL